MNRIDAKQQRLRPREINRGPRRFLRSGEKRSTPVSPQYRENSATHEEIRVFKLRKSACRSDPWLLSRSNIRTRCTRSKRRGCDSASLEVENYSKHKRKLEKESDRAHFSGKNFFFFNKIIHRSRNVEWFIVLFYTLRTSERRKICRVLVSPNLMLRVQEAIYFQLIYIYTACLNPGHGRGFNVSWTEESVYEFVKWWKEYRRMTISLFFIDYACKLQRNLSRYIIMANAIPLSFQETQNCSTAILGLLLIILKMNFRLLI